MAYYPNQITIENLAVVQDVIRAFRRAAIAQKPLELREPELYTSKKSSANHSSRRTRCARSWSLNMELLRP